MKAISLWEPYASLIRTGAKKFETRSWATKYRGELLICAAKRKRIYELIHYLCMQPFQRGLAPLLGKPLMMSGGYFGGVKIEHLYFGKAVAIVDLVDCKRTDDLTLEDIDAEQHFGDFSLGRYAWKMVLKEAIEPFPVKGKQGFFDVEFDWMP